MAVDCCGSNVGSTACRPTISAGCGPSFDQRRHVPRRNRWRGAGRPRHCKPTRSISSVTRYLRNHPGGDRIVAGGACARRPLQGPQPHADGSLGVRRDRLPRVGPRGAARRGHGRHRIPGAGRQRRQRVDAGGYKDGDANVRSVWLCSRNDAIGNVAVMLAAVGVWGTATSGRTCWSPRSWRACSCIRPCRSCGRPCRSSAAARSHRSHVSVFRRRALLCPVVDPTVRTCRRDWRNRHSQSLSRMGLPDRDGR